MLIFDSWLKEYSDTILDILQNRKELKIDDEVALTYFERNQNSKWSALIYLQENIKSFSFNEWMRYVDHVIKLIIDKDSSEIEDIPYYDLWNNSMNPLVIALYAIFQSSETLDDTDLPNDANEIWDNSNNNDKIS